LEFREPSLADAVRITQLVRQCPPLDVNSHYLYLLLCRDFQATCVVVESESGLAGFLSAFIPPQRNDTIFIWQVAVDSQQRGAGIASRMLNTLLARSICDEVRWLETNITPSNSSSQKLFRSLAARLQTECLRSEGFPAELFEGAGEHEPEDLYRIGPFKFNKP